MSAVVKFVATNIAPIGLLLAAEKWAPAYLGLEDFALLAPTKFGLPRLYGAVVLFNVVATSFLVVILGVRVGMARSKYVEDAKKKDNDEHAEARYTYPKLYAEGFSETAKRFNCLQRSHQQTLESLPQFLTLSLIGGVSFPATTAVAGLLALIARYKWADGYRTGIPKDRYASAWAKHIWTTLLMVLVTASATGVCALSGCL